MIPKKANKSRFYNESRHKTVRFCDGILNHITDPRNGVRYMDLSPSRDPSRSITDRDLGPKKKAFLPCFYL